MMMLWEPGLWGNIMVAQHHTKQFFFSTPKYCRRTGLNTKSALGTFISVQGFLLLGFNALYHSNGAFLYGAYIQWTCLQWLSWEQHFDHYRLVAAI